MGKKPDASSAAQVPKHMWKNSSLPPPNLQNVLNQVAHFVHELGYFKTATTLQKEASKHNVNINVTEWAQSDKHVPLLELYQSSRDHGSSDTSDDSSDEDSEDDSESKDPTEGVLVDVEAEETSDDESDEKSEGETAAKSQQLGQKRKRILTPPSSASSEDSSASDDSDSDDSASSSDSDSSSDGDTRRPAKKAKVQESDSSSASDTHSDSDSSSSDDQSSASEDEDNSSDSDSDSDSNSGPKPASASTSSESSDSDSDDDSSSSSDAPPPPAPEKSKKPGKAKPSKAAKPKQAETQDRSGSTSSTTLDGEPAAASDGKVHPDRLLQVGATAAKEDLLVPDHVHPDRVKRVPATKENIMELKKQNVPFSRIPTDQRIDPRFSSNAYVPYDYANRAHQDLIVTKGKGFTKEKNKKKRGAYRGGTIDVTPKGIKFDD